MFRKRDRRQVQQPRRDHTATTPQLRNLRDIEVILIVFRITQWRSFRIRRSFELSFVCVMQDVESFSVCRHQAILDPVVNHLYEVTRARCAAVQVAFGRCACTGWPSGRRRRRIASGRERLEDRIEKRDHIFLAANHLAITALESPHAATRSNVNIM